MNLETIQFYITRVIFINVIIRMRYFWHTNILYFNLHFYDFQLNKINNIF